MSMLRYVAPTRPQFTYTARETRDERRETRRDETRRGESYSAGLTAQARRESCQFRSDPRVRVPETAGLALVSTRIPPVWVFISITAAVWEEFRRTNSHAFFSSAKATRRRFISVLKRSLAIRSRWHTFLILDIHVWQTRCYAYWWRFFITNARW